MRDNERVREYREREKSILFWIEHSSHISSESFLNNHHLIVMSILRHALLVSIILTVIPAQFNIPLPFGGISLNKNEKGEVYKTLGKKNKTNKKENFQLEIGGTQNFNILGWGANRDFKLTTGNGTFKLDSKWN